MGTVPMKPLTVPCGCCAVRMHPTGVQAQCMRVRVLQNSGAPDVQWSEWWFVDGQGKKLLPSAVLSNSEWQQWTGSGRAVVGVVDVQWSE